ADAIWFRFTGCIVEQQMGLTPLCEALGIDHHRSRGKLTQCLQQPFIRKTTGADNGMNEIVDNLTLRLDEWDQLIHCCEQASFGTYNNILSVSLMWPTDWALLRPKQV